MRALLCGLLLALLLAAPAQALYGPVGTLSPNGCTRSNPGAFGDPQCTDGRVVTAPWDIAMSVDERHVFVADTDSDGIATFTRDLTTGVLAQPADNSGCVTDTGANQDAKPCRLGENLAGVRALAVSADGRHLYAAGSNGVSGYEIDAATGRLDRLPGSSACVSNDGTDSLGNASQCVNGRAVNGATDIVLSPDGTRLYVGATTEVAILTRDPATGGLSQGPGAQGCVSANGGVSPPGGTAGQGCAAQMIRGLTGTTRMAISGPSVYLASGQAIIALEVQPDGTLVQPAGAAGCIHDVPASTGCADGRALGVANDVAVSPDGASVYFAGGDAGEIGHARRGAGGVFTQASDASGCVKASGTDSGFPCAVGRAIHNLFFVTAAPDGATVYSGAAPGGTAIGIFDRGAGGALTQPSEARGCIVELGASDCTPGGGAAGPFVFTRDGSHAYVAGMAQGPDAFRREVAPACTTPPATETTAPAPVSVVLACSDANGDAVTLQPGEPPARGSVAIDGMTVTYTPSGTAAGADVFTVRAFDGTNLGGAVVFLVTIAAPPASSPPPGVAPVPPPTVLPLVSKAALPTLRTRSARPDRRRRVRLSLACPAGARPACAGRIVLRTSSKVRVRRGKARKRLTVGRASYRLAAGRRATVTLRVSADTARALRLSRRLSLTATLTAARAAGFAPSSASVKLTLRR